MSKLVEIINDRNAIIDGLDEDRLRCVGCSFASPNLTSKHCSLELPLSAYSLLYFNSSKHVQEPRILLPFCFECVNSAEL